MAGTSAPFLAAGSAVAWQKARKKLGLKPDETAEPTVDTSAELGARFDKSTATSGDRSLTS